MDPATIMALAQGLGQTATNSGEGSSSSSSSQTTETKTTTSTGMTGSFNVNWDNAKNENLKYLLIAGAVIAGLFILKVKYVN